MSFLYEMNEVKELLQNAAEFNMQRACNAVNILIRLKLVLVYHDAFNVSRKLSKKKTGRW